MKTNKLYHGASEAVKRDKEPVLWSKSKFDCTFSLYESGEYEIVQGYEQGWQINKAGNFVASCDSLKEAKEVAISHWKFNS